MQLNLGLKIDEKESVESTWGPKASVHWGLSFVSVLDCTTNDIYRNKWLFCHLFFLLSSDFSILYFAGQTTTIPR